MEFESVIGLEVHVQLDTDSKIFCSAPAHFRADPNRHIDEFTLGLPGALPVVNRKVVECAIMLGLAMNCSIKRLSRFARKHYFYPDLPKGYQISQFEEPICTAGHLRLRYQDSERQIGITRIHMEEDAGKTIHHTSQHCSTIDLNRAGVPLLEIVSQPDIRSPGEAAEYMRTIRQLVRYLRISDGNMQEGSLRCDANISLRPVGSMEFGARTEIKNINSFKFVERALEYEIARQLALLKQNQEVGQETRLFDSETGTTHLMRTKEESADYRYFPDPDLPPLIIEESWINEIRNHMPALPDERKAKFTDIFGLSDYDALVLTSEAEYADYFEEVFGVCSNAKAASSWISSELFGRLNKEGMQLSDSRVSAAMLGELIALLDAEVISGKMAKVVFDEMWISGEAAQAIVDARGLRLISDPDEVRPYVLQALEGTEKQIAEYHEGNQKVISFFVGNVMKLTQGNASPRTVNEILKEELDKRKP